MRCLTNWGSPKLIVPVSCWLSVAIWAISIGEAEVKDVEILCHTLLVGALGDGHDAALRQPAQGHLRGAFAVLAAYDGKLVALDDAASTLLLFSLQPQNISVAAANVKNILFIILCIKYLYV